MLFRLLGLKCPAPTETPRLMSDLTTNVLLHSSQVARTDALASVVHFCPVGFAVSRGGQKERTCLSRCGNWYSTLTTKSYSVCYRTSTEWSGVPPTCKSKSNNRVSLLIQALQEILFRKPNTVPPFINSLPHAHSARLA